METKMFGFSFINCKELESFTQAPNNVVFKVIEIPYNMTKDIRVMQFPQIIAASTLHIRRLVESSVSRTITEHSESLAKSFISHFNDAMQMNSSGIATATLDFGIERAFANPQLRTNLIQFIKRLAPAIIPAPFPVLLPVRVPFYAAEQGTDYAIFLRDLVISNCALSLDIHPHELAGQTFSPASFLRPLRFDIGLIRFIYEPAIGNRLVEKVLAPWLKYLQKIEYRGDIIFCPASGDHEIFEREYTNLTKLSSKLNYS
jgi:hypothetical protein